MSHSTTQHKTAADRFSDPFIAAARACGVREPVVSRYVIRVEEYMKAFPDRRLTCHTRNDLECYLHELGSNNHLEDWQFRQSVDALQILFHQIVKAPWVDEVNWDY